MTKFHNTYSITDILDAVEYQMAEDSASMPPQKQPITIIGCHNDADGWASAAQILQVKKTYGDSFTHNAIEVYALQHGDVYKSHEDSLVESIVTHIKAGDSIRVVLLDYCLSAKHMSLLFDLATDYLGYRDRVDSVEDNSGNGKLVGFIWVDHHTIPNQILLDLGERAFINSMNVPEHYKHVIRLDPNKAACLQVAELVADIHEHCIEKHENLITADNPVLKAIANRDVGDFEMSDDNDKITSALHQLTNHYSFTCFGIKTLLEYTQHFIWHANSPAYGLEYLLQLGDTMCQEREQRFQQCLGKAFMLRVRNTITDQWFNCAATFSDIDLVTVLAAKLSSDTKMAGCAITRNRNRYVLNFRSHDGDAVTAIDCANMLGGGGHEHAAGADIDTSSLIRHLDNSCSIIIA